MNKWINKIHEGDAVEVMKEMPDEFIDMAITSPPYYGLRDYGIEGQIGLEETLDEYLDRMLEVTAELHRVLKPKGTLWWVHGDSYSTSHSTGTTDAEKGWKSGELGGERQRHHGRANGGNIPTKSLMLQNFRLAQRMVDEQGWILRNVIIWHKPNCMPSSAKDRFTVDFEPIFFFSKEKQYYFEQQFEPYKSRYDSYEYDGKNIKDYEGGKAQKPSDSKRRILKSMKGGKGRNKRTVWEVTTKGFPEAHFAVYPEELIETPIMAGCPKEICKKCGRAREKIVETVTEEFNPREDEKYSGGSDFMSKKTTLRSKTKTVKKGYRECDCEPEKWADFDILGKPIKGVKSKWRPGIVLDPFMGAGTTGIVAKKLKRNYIGIELNPEYVEIAKRRIRGVTPPLI